MEGIKPPTLPNVSVLGLYKSAEPSTSTSSICGLPRASERAAAPSLRLCGRYALRGQSCCARPFTGAQSRIVMRHNAEALAVRGTIAGNAHLPAVRRTRPSVASGLALAQVFAELTLFFSILATSACGGTGTAAFSAPGAGNPEASGKASGPLAYVPFASYAIPGTSGVTGLVVVPVAAIDQSPNVVMSQTRIIVLAYGSHHALDSSGRVAAGEPDSVFFATDGQASGDHIYSLELTATSPLVPRQVGNLTLAGKSRVICSVALVQNNLADSRAGFLLLGLSPLASNPCAPGPGTAPHYVRITLADDTQTAPLDTSWSRVLPLYDSSGALSGIVATDTGHNLTFYQKGDPAEPLLLRQGVSDFTTYQPHAADVSGIATTPEFAFLVASESDGSFWYRVDAAGNISPRLHSVSGPQLTPIEVVFDASGMYILDLDVNNAERVVRFNDDGQSAANELYASGIGYFQYPVLTIGGLTRDSVLLIRRLGVSSLEMIPSCPCELLALPKTASGAPTPLVGWTNFLGEFLLWSPSSASIDYLLQAPDSTGSGNTTRIVSRDGTVLQPTVAQSTFLGTLGRALLETRSPGDPIGVSEAAIYEIETAGQFAVTPLTRPGGGSLSLPSSTAGYPALVQFNSTIGTLCVSTTAGSFIVSTSFVVDISKKQIAQVVIPNSSFSPLSPSPAQC
jgi:hypothetical protein